MIWKSHEKVHHFEKFMVEVKEYVTTEYSEGSDLELLIESQVDDFDMAADTKLPSL